jgi:gas vesicle protein
VTDTEQYQIIGQVVKTHEDAKRHMTILKAKAKAMAEFIYQVGSALSGEASWASSDGTLTISRHNNYAGGAKGQWPSENDVLAVLRQMSDLKKEIESLEKQRKELGV